MNIEEKRNFNIKLYPIYKMFAWDLLFYYAISFLFLTEVKGFSGADVVLLDVSIYTLFKCLSQLPSTIITDKLGKRMSLIVGNIFISFSILFIIQCPNIYVLALAEFCMAFGFAIKSIAEPNILYDSITGVETKGNLFSKLDGKGSSFYYYLNAVASLATGFLYAINPYIPVLVCLMLCIVATVLSSFFYSLRDNSSKKEDDAPKAIYRIKEYSKELQYVFKHIIKSSRLRYLILFYALFQSLIAVTTTLDRSLLTDLRVPPAYFGIIYAALSILSGVSSYSPNLFHRKFKNRVLTVFSICFISSCLISGLFATIKIPFTISIAIILLSLGIRAIIKGPFYTLYKQYLGNFAGTNTRTKIYSVTYLFENLCGAIIAFLVSRLLDISSTAIAFVALGFAYTFVFIFLLNNMKSHVGLKPEQYKKDDINLIDIKWKLKQWDTLFLKSVPLS